MATLDWHIAEESVQHRSLTSTNAANDSDNLTGADIKAGHGELEAVAIMTLVLQDSIVHLDTNLLLGEDGVGLAIEGGSIVGLGVQQELLNALQGSLCLCMSWKC